MTLLLALLPLAIGPQEWTALPLPEPARPRTRLAVEIPAAGGSHLHFDEWQIESPAASDSEIPANMVVQWLQEEARRRGSQLSVAPSTPPLLISGTPEDLVWARSLLDGLDAIGQQLEVEIEAWLVPAQIAADPGPAALSSLENVRHWSSSTHSGEAVLFGAPGRRAFVAGYDVEVATDSGVAAPVIGQVEVGEQLYMRAHRVNAGHAVQIFGTLDLAELERVETFDPGTPDLGDTEQPVVDFARVSFSGRIGRDDSLRVSISGSDVQGGDWTLFVRARTRVEFYDMNIPPVGYRVLDLALIASDPVALPPIDAGTSLARFARLPELRGASGSAPPSGVLAMLGRDRRREVERPAVQWTDRLLLVHMADPARHKQLSGLVDQLEAVRAPTTTVRVEQGSLAVEFPVAAGVPARVLVGTERTLLVGYDAEIASNTWMPAPHSAVIFDGLAWQGRLQGRALAGECFRSTTDAIHVRDRSAASMGSLQLPERRHAAGRGRVAPGERSAWLPAVPGMEALVVSRGNL